MILLKDNKLVQVNTIEDEGVVLATKTKEKLNSPYATKDVTYKLFSEKEGYIFRVVESQLNDNSNLNRGFNDHNISKGNTIQSILNYDYKVTIDGIEIESL